MNHVTRMTAPRICIAGIDCDTGEHVRPVTGKADPLLRDHLAENGGPVELGGVVDLGSATPRPSRPETEDHFFQTNAARLIERLPADEYLELIDDHCVDDLEDVLGPALERHRWKYAIDAGEGDRSLGCLRVQTKPELFINDYDRLQLRLNDPERPAYLPVTDLRFFEEDHQTIRAAAVDDAQGRISRGVPVRLMLGVARAWVASGDDEERHWLQVNGICLEDRPLGGTP
jgi:hypothetical protein